jgi:hypothetical protein
MKYFFLIFLCIVSLNNYSFAQLNFQEKKSYEGYCDCEITFLTADTSTNDNLGFHILKTGYKMAIVDKTIVRGSCWDYANAIYKQSGFESQKYTIFKSVKSGPYAAANIIQSGDWIYHINHQFNNVEHSAIFICWKDFSKKIGITLSYSGRNRNEPGRFGAYDLNNIYSVFRPMTVIKDGKK